LVAVIWYVKALPRGPLAVVALVITGANAAMVTVRLALPVPPELVALMVTVDVPEAVGVPEIKPVTVLSDRPTGNTIAP
jgi:hypothetical protein